MHRDVKPSNLLVDESGKLWVTDFGLARCRENAGLTQTGDVLGTMRYMSPEQALGRTALIDHRTDIYSLGVTLYELATLVHPAEGVSDLQLYFNRSRPSIKPLRRWNPHIPVDFQTIVMKSVSEFPIERYSTAQRVGERFGAVSGWKADSGHAPERRHAGQQMGQTPSSCACHRDARGVCRVAREFVAIDSRARKRELALARSEQSVEHAHAVLDRFGSRLVDQLAAIPGAEGVRRQLLEDSLDLYRQFERQASEDIALAPDLGSAYGKMGSLAEKMGEIEQSRELHTKARRFWEARLADEPDNLEYLGNLALCQHNLAMLLAEEGQTADALDLLQQARHKQVRLAVLDHGAYAADLAATHSNLGLVLTKTGAKKQAVRELKEAIALQERLRRTSPDDESLLRGLMTSYSRLSSILASSDSDAAVGIYSKLITIQLRFVKSDPTNRLYQGDLARTYTNLGFVLCSRQEWKNAEVCYSDAILIQENLMSASPYAAAYRRDLAISYNNLGMLQSRSGQVQQAASSFRKAEQLQQRLLVDEATDTQLLSNQGSVLNNLGLALDRMGHAAAAESAFREAVRFQKRALEESPNDAQLRTLLSRHYFNYARSLRSQKKFDEAVAVAIERGDLWQGQPEGLLSVAKELAEVCHQMSGVPSATMAAKDECVLAAVNVLREALIAGLPADRLRHSALAPLASHAAYRALLIEINPAGPSPQSTHHAQTPTRGELNTRLGKPGK